MMGRVARARAVVGRPWAAGRLETVVGRTHGQAFVALLNVVGPPDLPEKPCMTLLVDAQSLQMLTETSSLYLFVHWGALM